MQVQFSTPSEFLDELDLDLKCGGIDRNIVRVTLQYRTATTLPLVSIYVLAGYLNYGAGVFLRHYVGDEMPNVPMDNKPSDRAEEVLSSLTVTLKAKGLEVRHGVFVLGDPLNVQALKDDA